MTSSKRPIGELVELVRELQKLGALRITDGDFEVILEPRSTFAGLPLDSDEDPLLVEHREAGKYRKKKAQKAMSEEDARARRAAVERELYASSEGM